MKKTETPIKVFTILFVFTTLLSSCSIQSHLYRQIATLSSDNVIMSDDGAFTYETPDFVVSYDFWSEYGKCVFTIQNKTDNDIYLDLSNSHFIKNHQAFGYSENLTYNYAKPEPVQNKTSMVNLFLDIDNSATPVVKEDETKALRDVINTNQAAICIPANCYKTIGKFPIAYEVYQECGLIRDPQNKEIAVRNFEENHSPMLIENRLTFLINGTREKVLNKFFVSQYENIDNNLVFRAAHMKKCDGTPYVTNVCIRRATNKFYIMYDTNHESMYSGYDNGRVRKKYGF